LTRFQLRVVCGCVRATDECLLGFGRLSVRDLRKRGTRASLRVLWSHYVLWCVKEEIMDDTQFDNLTRTVGRQSDRRGMLKAAAGGVLALVGLSALTDGASARKCKKDKDCPPRKLCKNTKCVECKSDRNCSNKSVCLKNRCVRKCKSNTDCGKNEFCVKKECVECKSNRDCDLGQKCTNSGRCKTT
jgi:hypothetical protein